MSARHGALSAPVICRTAGARRAGRFAAALHRMLLAAVVAAFAAPAPATTPPAASVTRESIVVLGDSISAGYGIPVTSGWVALLGERLAQRGYGYRVANASVSGETTAGALARLPHVLAVQSPRIVLVELGGNDGLRGLPVAQTQANLERIVTLVQDSGAVAVVIGMRVPPNYGPAYTAQFAKTYGDVARLRKAPLVPFLLEAIAGDQANFQADGIHPVAGAQPKLLDTVWPVLEPLLKTAARTAPARAAASARS